jgi:hypothetical protein
MPNVEVDIFQGKKSSVDQCELASLEISNIFANIEIQLVVEKILEKIGPDFNDFDIIFNKENIGFLIAELEQDPSKLNNLKQALEGCLNNADPRELHGSPEPFQYELGVSLGEDSLQITVSRKSLN